jgi:hypothetical protein
MKTKALILFLIISNTIFAQITIQSQYYNNELFLNPAMTGLIERKWRLKNVHRMQFDQDFHQNNNMIFADYKQVFNKKTGDYGLVMTEFTGYMMGIGLMHNRITHSLETPISQTTNISLAFHKLLKKQNYFSFGIQPGIIQNGEQQYFDLNIGLMFGSNIINCWQEDQYFRSQFGVSVYNAMSDFTEPDSSAIHSRKIQAHYGYLLQKPKHFNIALQSAAWFDNKLHFTAGAVVLFFPVVHYAYFDRGRLGLHYRNSHHLVFSAGTRLYGRGQKTISLDGLISFDIPMKIYKIQPHYKNGIELGILITPLIKCWSLSKC